MPTVTVGSSAHQRVHSPKRVRGSDGIMPVYLPYLPWHTNNNKMLYFLQGSAGQGKNAALAA